MTAKIHKKFKNLRKIIVVLSYIQGYLGVFGAATWLRRLGRSICLSNTHHPLRSVFCDKHKDHKLKYRSSEGMWSRSRILFLSMSYRRAMVGVSSNVTLHVSNVCRCSNQTWRNCCEGLRLSFPLYVAPLPPLSDLRNILNKTHAMGMRPTLLWF